LAKKLDERFTCAINGRTIWERSGIDLSQVPPLMDVNDLVDAALIGFDRKETIKFRF
jgi:hypothetical protein